MNVSNGTKQEGGYRRRTAPVNPDRAEQPRVTIITAVRNGKEYLAQTIQSVLGQTYGNIEYIVIDGRSTDGTLDIIRKYEDRIAYWISEQDTGIYDAMDKGIEAATGVLVNLLNADDYLENDAVETVVREYLGMDRPDIIYGNACYIDEKYQVRAEYISRIKPWVGMTVNHQSMFVARTTYGRIGAYDRSYRYAGDYDFFLRAIGRNVRFHKIERILVNCRNAGANVVFARQSRKEAGRITRIHFGALAPQRLFFLVYNHLWVPLKFWLRDMLYRTAGPDRTRRLFSLLKGRR